MAMLPIPANDYVKLYQRNPDQLWPVEFFLLTYRRRRGGETEILVRPSANGTAKWGLGTGVPVTRWLEASQQKPPRGYQWSNPAVMFASSNFPEFEGEESWMYQKIDICENAFDHAELHDAELEEYSRRVQEQLQKHIAKQLIDLKVNSWQHGTLEVANKVLDNANSVAAIQGTLRMSGLFATRQSGKRYIELAQAPDPVQLARSMRIYTMFPQMPCPMPLPGTSAQDLQQEIATRSTRIVASGRDPHQDKYGRKFTHISTSNVSNTIHGVYLTLDATDMPGLDTVPAIDVFGTKQIERQWQSLVDVKVLDTDGKTIGAGDTKPTFISGLIVRQLVKDNVIDIYGDSPL